MCYDKNWEGRQAIILTSYYTNWGNYYTNWAGLEKNLWGVHFLWCVPLEGYKF